MNEKSGKQPSKQPKPGNVPSTRVKGQNRTTFARIPSIKKTPPRAQRVLFSSTSNAVNATNPDPSQLTDYAPIPVLPSSYPLPLPLRVISQPVDPIRPPLGVVSRPSNIAQLHPRLIPQHSHAVQLPQVSQLSPESVLQSKIKSILQSGNQQLPPSFSYKPVHIIKPPPMKSPPKYVAQRKDLIKTPRFIVNPRFPPPQYVPHPTDQIKPPAQPIVQSVKSINPPHSYISQPSTSTQLPPKSKLQPTNIIHPPPKSVSQPAYRMQIPPQNSPEPPPPPSPPSIPSPPPPKSVSKPTNPMKPSPIVKPHVKTPNPVLMQPKPILQTRTPIQPAPPTKTPTQSPPIPTRKPTIPIRAQPKRIQTPPTPARPAQSPPMPMRKPTIPIRAQPKRIKTPPISMQTPAIPIRAQPISTLQIKPSLTAEPLKSILQTVYPKPTRSSNRLSRSSSIPPVAPDNHAEISRKPGASAKRKHSLDNTGPVNRPLRGVIETDVALPRKRSGSSQKRAGSSQKRTGSSQKRAGSSVKRVRTAQTLKRNHPYSRPSRSRKSPLTSAQQAPRNVSTPRNVSAARKVKVSSNVIAARKVKVSSNIRTPHNASPPLNLIAPSKVSSPLKVKVSSDVRAPPKVSSPCKVKVSTNVRAPPKVSSPLKVKVSSNVRAPLNLIAPPKVSSPRKVKVSTNVRAPLNLIAPSKVSVPPKVKVSSNVRAFSKLLVPLNVSAPRNLKVSSNSRPLRNLLAPRNVPTPLNVKVSGNIEAPLNVSAPLNVKVSGNIEAPLNVSAPRNVKMPLTFAKPSSGRAPLSAPIRPNPQLARPTSAAPVTTTSTSTSIPRKTVTIAAAVPSQPIRPTGPSRSSGGLDPPRSQITPHSDKSVRPQLSTMPVQHAPITSAVVRGAPKAKLPVERFAQRHTSELIPGLTLINPDQQPPNAANSMLSLKTRDFSPRFDVPKPRNDQILPGLTLLAASDKKKKMEKDGFDAFVRIAERLKDIPTELEMIAPLRSSTPIVQDQRAAANSSVAMEQKLRPSLDPKVVDKQESSQKKRFTITPSLPNTINTDTFARPLDISASTSRSIVSKRLRSIDRPSTSKSLKPPTFRTKQTAAKSAEHRVVKQPHPTSKSRLQFINFIRNAIRKYYLPSQSKKPILVKWGRTAANATTRKQQLFIADVHKWKFDKIHLFPLRDVKSTRASPTSNTGPRGNKYVILKKKLNKKRMLANSATTIATIFDNIEIVTHGCCGGLKVINIIDDDRRFERVDKNNISRIPVNQNVNIANNSNRLPNSSTSQTTIQRNVITKIANKPDGHRLQISQFNKTLDNEKQLPQKPVSSSKEKSLFEAKHPSIPIKGKQQDKLQEVNSNVKKISLADESEMSVFPKIDELNETKSHPTDHTATFLRIIKNFLSKHQNPDNIAESNEGETPVIDKSPASIHNSVNVFPEDLVSILKRVMYDDEHDVEHQWIDKYLVGSKPRKRIVRSGQLEGTIPREKLGAIRKSSDQQSNTSPRTTTGDSAKNQSPSRMNERSISSLVPIDPTKKADTIRRQSLTFTEDSADKTVEKNTRYLGNTISPAVGNSNSTPYSDSNQRFKVAGTNSKATSSNVTARRTRRNKKKVFREDLSSNLKSLDINSDVFYRTQKNKLDQLQESRGITIDKNDKIDNHLNCNLVGNTLQVGLKDTNFNKNVISKKHFDVDLNLKQNLFNHSEEIENVDTYDNKCTDSIKSDKRPLMFESLNQSIIKELNILAKKVNSKTNFNGKPYVTQTEWFDKIFHKKVTANHVKQNTKHHSTPIDWDHNIENLRIPGFDDDEYKIKNPLPDRKPKSPEFNERSPVNANVYYLDGDKQLSIHSRILTGKKSTTYGISTSLLSCTPSSKSMDKYLPTASEGQAAGGSFVAVRCTIDTSEFNESERLVSPENRDLITPATFPKPVEKPRLGSSSSPVTTTGVREGSALVGEPVASSVPKRIASLSRLISASRIQDDIPREGAVEVKIPELAINPNHLTRSYVKECADAVEPQGCSQEVLDAVRLNVESALRAVIKDAVQNHMFNKDTIFSCQNFNEGMKDTSRETVLNYKPTESNRTQVLSVVNDEGNTVDLVCDLPFELIKMTDKKLVQKVTTPTIIYEKHYLTDKIDDAWNIKYYQKSVRIIEQKNPAVHKLLVNDLRNNLSLNMLVVQKLLEYLRIMADEDTDDPVKLRLVVDICTAFLTSKRLDGTIYTEESMDLISFCLHSRRVNMLMTDYERTHDLNASQFRDVLRTGHFMRDQRIKYDAQFMNALSDTSLQMHHQAVSNIILSGNKQNIYIMLNRVPEMIEHLDKIIDDPLITDYRWKLEALILINQYLVIIKDFSKNSLESNEMFYIL